MYVSNNYLDHQGHHHRGRHFLYCRFCFAYSITGIRHDYSLLCKHVGRNRQLPDHRRSLSTGHHSLWAYPSNLGFVICLVVYVLVLKNVVTRDYHRDIIACLEEAVREDIEIIGDGSLVKTYLEARAAMHSFMTIDRIICNSWDCAREEKQFVAREYAKGNLEKRIVDGKVCYCRPLAKKQLKYWGQI